MLSFLFCSLAAIALAPLAGRYPFRRRVAREVAILLSSATGSVGPQQLAARLDSLPEPVRRYLRFAIADGAQATRTIRLEHGGTFRTKPGQGWMPDPWSRVLLRRDAGIRMERECQPGAARVDRGSRQAVQRARRYAYEIGIAIPNRRRLGPEIDHGASLRWLVEAVWFPYAFVSDAVCWEPVSGDAARVTVVQDGAPVAAVVEFDAEGRMARIRGERYRDMGGGKTALTPWLGRCSAYREFGPFRVPAQVEVAWVLDGVEFAYARFDVTAIEV